MGTEQGKDAVQLAEEYISNKYEKVRLLHRTDKAAVWLAADSGGNFVVIKNIKLANLPYSVLKNMGKSIWPEVIYCTEDEQSTVVVEEFITGDSLDELLAKKQYLTEALAQELLLQLCDGLLLLHKHGIIHRDIKPSNIIVQNIGERQFLRLIDFDAARTVKEEQGEDTRLLGTKGYAPPEQYGYGQTDQRSDIYSLGITFQEMLGKNYHGWLASILKKCVEVDVNRRYQSVAALKNALLYHRCNRRLKIAGIIGAVLLAALGTWAYRQHSQQESIIPPAVEEFVREEKEKLLGPVETREQLQTGGDNTSIKADDKSKDERLQESGEVDKKANNDILKDGDGTEANAVYAKYYMNGERLGGWTDFSPVPANNFGAYYTIPPNIWKTWGDTYPAEWNMRVTVENKSNKSWENPYLSVWTNDGVGGESKDYYGPTLAPGESCEFVVSLSDFKLPALHKDRRRQEMFFNLYATGGQVLFGEKTYLTFELKNK